MTVALGSARCIRESTFWGRGSVRQWSTVPREIRWATTAYRSADCWWPLWQCGAPLRTGLLRAATSSEGL